MALGYRPSPRTSHGTPSACEYSSTRPLGLLPAPGCSHTLTHPRAGDGVGGARLLGSVASRGVGAFLRRYFGSQKLGAQLSPGAGFKGPWTGCQPILTPTLCALHRGRPSPPHSTLFRQDTCESVPESLPGTQEKSFPHMPSTVSPFGHLGLGWVLSEQVDLGSEGWLLGAMEQKFLGS